MSRVWRSCRFSGVERILWGFFVFGGFGLCMSGCCVLPVGISAVTWGGVQVILSFVVR